MRKPKKLYRYDISHTLNVHECHATCSPQIVEHKSHGTLYRCHHGAHHDSYGYEKREEAKIEEIGAVKRELYELNNWLQVLMNQKPGTKKRMILNP